MSTVIITGSRNFTDYSFICSALDKEHAEDPITLLVEGGAQGADDLAALWAHKHNVPHVCVPAEWHTHGKSAGPKRNRKMLLAYPDARVIGFPRGESRGTRGCLKMARGFGMKVVEYGL